MYSLNMFSDFFDWITEFFTTITDIIQHFFHTLAYFYNLLHYAYTYLFLTLATIPDWIRVFAGVCISVSILYLLIGRETGTK